MVMAPTTATVSATPEAVSRFLLVRLGMSWLAAMGGAYQNRPIRSNSWQPWLLLRGNG